MSLWGNKDSKTASGTVTITKNADGITGNVVGSSTTFTTQARVGNYIVVAGNNYVITTIGNTTFATVESGINGANVVAQGGGSAYALSEKPAFVAQAEASENKSATSKSGNAERIFGVSAAEATVGTSNATVSSYTVITGGSGYAANATVTVAQPDGTANTQLANSTVAIGRVTAVTVNTSIGGYKTKPTVTVAAPAAINITANTTGVVAATDFIKFATANSKFLAGDRLYYGVGASNTAITPLTGNAYYYVSFANTTGVCLAETAGGANINITDTRTDATAEVHTFQGDTATAFSALTGGKSAGSSGWVRRIVGTGGRAGRVQEETLVAMGSISSDAADDTVYPDA